MRVRHIFLGTSKLGAVLIFFAAVTCFFGFRPASAAVIGLDAVHFYNTYWGRYNLYSGANYGGFRILITDEPPLGLEHEIVPLTEFNAGELAGVDVAVFLISTIGRLNPDGSRDFGDGIPYTDDQIATIQAFALKGAVFLSDSTMLSTYMGYGDNRILAKNIINHLVESGGGVLFIADNNGDESWACDIDNWNELVAPFGIEYSLPLPDHNYPETWIYDFVEHPITEGVSELRVLSYPKNTIVWPSQDLTVNPSPEDVLAVYPFPVGEVDGTLDPDTNSYVIDDVYGVRAYVRNYLDYWDEWPTEPMEVTLYVTDDPPAGMPGVEAQGTPFMHIDLDPPPPSYPTPPMGIDVRLPLLEPQPVGSRVYLMRVDPDTGELVPADQWGIACDNWICPDPGGICFEDCPEYSREQDQSLWTEMLNPDPAGCRCYVNHNPTQPCPSDVLQGEECGSCLILRTGRHCSG
jgi:hypothetical protein